MALKCKIVEKDEKLDNAILTLGFPDEQGQIVSLTGVSEADMDAVEEGDLYVIGFTRYVPAAPEPADAVSAPVIATVTVAPDPAATTAADPGAASGT